MYFRKSKQSLIACPRATGGTLLVCHGQDQCSSPAKQPETGKCMVREIVDVWNYAGFSGKEIQTEANIIDKIIALAEKYQR